MDNIYTTDEYLAMNSSLHEEDSSWKIEKILPLVDKFVLQVNKTEINMLDVGGGAGLILKAVAEYIEERYKIKVNKYFLDLSPGMLNVQKQNNVDFVEAFNETISQTSISNKKIDLVLMIDILEHVPDDIAALKELARISNYVIFKVPLENSLLGEFQKILKGNVDMKKLSEEKYGHVNFYSYFQLMRKIKTYLGEIKLLYPANVYDHMRKSMCYNKIMSLKYKLLCMTVARFIKIMPSQIYLNMFGDFAIILVRCHG